jgi:hypothetical protein
LQCPEQNRPDDRATHLQEHDPHDEPFSAADPIHEE